MGPKRRAGARKSSAKVDGPQQLSFVFCGGKTGEGGFVAKCSTCSLSEGAGFSISRGLQECF